MEHPQLIKPIFKKIISINQKLLNMKKIESPKKTKQNNYTSSKAKNATEIKKTKPKKCQKLSTMEDKSTNYNEYINYKVEFNIPHLFTVEAETESEFLNIKLGESDSIIDKPKESKIKSKIYDDSREIYDFTDKTHVDFVIFDKISHKPVLCIEVDGTKFHDYDKIRIEHDEIKNRALKANNINILRLKTNQSGEILKIRQYL